MNRVKHYWLPVFLLIFAVFSGILIFKSASFVWDKHFSLLAEAFIKNDLFLSPYNLPLGDIADYKGHQYLLYGPMPSILLIPPVFIFGKNFSQFTLSLISLAIVYAGIYLLSKRFVPKSQDSLMLANFFVFGTVLYFVGLLNISALLVQTVGTTFTILALLEYFTNKRWILIGSLVSAAALTRFTLFGIILFFLIELLRDKLRISLKNLALFLIPIIVSLIALGIYNNRRFQSPFETGYSYNINLKTYPFDVNSKFGLFSPKHIPANLYNLFLRGPDPVLEEGGGFILKFPFIKADGWGMAIWFTSPLFLYLFRIKKAPFTYPALITSFVLLIPSLLYSGIGFVQFGYRYSLDFLPLLFLVLLPAFKDGLPKLAKVLITVGILFNLFYMLSIWNSYPVFSFFANLFEK